jgi:YHS domain-containing protein
MKISVLIGAVIAAWIGLAAPAFAGAEVNTTPGAVLVAGKPAPGLAVHGFDVVAYFTEGRPVQGDAAFAAVHKEATYRFASQAHLDAFKANPVKYVPAYGGYCAYGVSVGAKCRARWSIPPSRSCPTRRESSGSEPIAARPHHRARWRAASPSPRSSPRYRDRSPQREGRQWATMSPPATCLPRAAILG